MDRRLFLTTLASGIVLAGAGVSAGYALDKNGVDPISPLLAGSPTPTPTPTLVYPDGRPVPTDMPANQAVYGQFPIPQLNKTRIPGGEMYSIPGNRGLLALTVDDGASSETIRGYCDFVERTGFRMTFFITSMYEGWTENKAQIGRLVESGHIQVANHTTTHKDLTKQTPSVIAAQLNGCEKFLRNTFGVSGRPYFRPPFGTTNDTVRRVAADVGYSTPVLWYGSFGDAGRCTPGQVENMANRWLLPDHIVIGHANFNPVLKVLDHIEALLHQRKLQPVTLDDMYNRA